MVKVDKYQFLVFQGIKLDVKQVRLNGVRVLFLGFMKGWGVGWGERIGFFFY